MTNFMHGFLQGLCIMLGLVFLVGVAVGAVIASLV